MEDGDRALGSGSSPKTSVKIIRPAHLSAHLFLNYLFFSSWRVDQRDRARVSMNRSLPVMVLALVGVLLGLSGCHLVFPFKAGEDSAIPAPDLFLLITIATSFFQFQSISNSTQ